MPQCSMRSALPDVHLPGVTADTRAALPPPGLGTADDPTARSVPAALLAEWLALTGWACDLRAGHGEAVAAGVAAALAHWRTLGLPAAQPGFDPVATLNFIKHASLAGRDDSWRRVFVANGRRLMWEHHAGAAQATPPTLANLPPRRFAVALSRTFQLAGIATSTALRLRLPLPLTGADLTDLVVQPAATAGSTLAVLSGRLEAKLVADGAATVTLAAQCHFVARRAPVAGVIEPPEPELYTRPSEGLIQVTPRVRALAAALAGADASPRDIVRVFWDHLLGRLCFGAIHYHAIPPAAPTDWVLAHGWTDCRIGSALLIALCRARGIPARLVGGHTLYEAAPFQHFWAEIWLAGTGWTPFDLHGSWDLSAGGRDAAWRDFFAGHVDYRMKTEVLPRQFTGPMSLRLPARWHVLAWRDGDGQVTGFFDLDTGRPVFSDRIAVRRGAQVAADSVNAGPL